MAKVVAEDAGTPYVLAVDNAKSTLAEVTTAIATGLGQGRVHVLSAAESEALLLKNDSVSALQVCGSSQRGVACSNDWLA